MPVLGPICSALTVGFAVVAVGAVAPGQNPTAPSPWSAVAADPAASMAQRGKLIIERGAREIAVFSAFTRRWSRLAVGPQATVWHANDWCLVRDGSRWMGFSAYMGEFVSPGSGQGPGQGPGQGAFLVNPGNQRNDSVAVVQDGNRVWTWSGFTGLWDSLSLPLGVMAHVAVQRHVVVVGAGQQVWGRSAWGTAWHPQATQAPVLNAEADGAAGVVGTARGLWGYSAAQESWRFTALASGGGRSTHLVGDVALWQLPAEVVAFSGLTGTFARAPLLLPPRSVTVDRQCAAVDMGASGGAAVLLYSAVTGQWLAHPVAAPSVSIRTEPALVVLEQADRVHGFSALTGQVASWMGRPQRLDATRGVAAATDGAGAITLFSAAAGGWFPSPAASGAVVHLGATGAFVESQSAAGNRQVWAFRSEDGAYVPLVRRGAPSAPMWFHADAESAAMGVSEADVVHAFDGRIGRWATVPLAGAMAPQVGQWRTNLVLVRGNVAAGFGAQTGEWSVQDLGAPPLSLRSSSEVTLVETSTQRWGFGAVPELLGQWQFPAFRRVQAAGAPVHLWQRRVASATTFVLVGPWSANGTPTPWPGQGELWVDPGSSGLLRVLGPAEGRPPVVRWTLPGVPPASLKGTAWAFQGVVVDRLGLRAAAPLGLQLW